MKTDSLIKPPGSKILKAGRVVLHPGEEIGEHTTDKREEIIIVVKGTAVLVKEGKEIILKNGDTHYIEEGILHNVKNTSKKKTEYVYVVCPMIKINKYT